MRSVLIIVLLFCCSRSWCQEVLATANKCYEEKNYQCAYDNYKKALAEKKYQQKDHATLLYRIGYSAHNLDKTDEAEKMYKETIAAKADHELAQWDLAALYYKIKKYETAAEYYGKAAASYKNNAKSLRLIYYWQGMSYYAAKKYTEALSVLKLSIQTDSSQANSHAAAGDASYSLLQYADAAKYYQKAIQLGDPDKEVMSYRYYWLGQAWFKLQKYDDAIVAYKGSIEYNAMNGDPVWGIAAVYYNQEKWADAAREYTNTMKFYKDDTVSMKDLYYYRGRCYINAKEYAKATADYDAILKISPTYRDAYWQKGNIFRDQKKYKEAISFYDKAIEIYSGVTASLDDLHYFRGFCHLQLKDTVKAETDFRESLKNNSSLRDANIGMAHISFGRKKYFEAKDYFAKSADGLKADSTELSRVYYRKGYSNFILGSTYYYTAKDDFLKSIRYDSNNRESRRWLADIYYSQQYFSLTEKEMDKCVVLYKAVKDSLPKMYLYRAMVRAQQKKYKESLEDYEQSDKLKKITDAGHVRNMGQFAFEIKDYAKTITLFTRLIPLYKTEQKNELAFAYYARGRAYHEQKSKPKAKADLEKAVEILPTYTEAKKWLDMVNKTE